MIHFKVTGEPNAIMVYDEINRIYFLFIGHYSDKDDISELYLYTNCDRGSSIKVATDVLGKLFITGVDEV